MCSQNTLVVVEIPIYFQRPTGQNVGVELLGGEKTETIETAWAFIVRRSR